MTTAQIVITVIIAVPLTLAIMNRLRVDIAAVLIMLALGVAQFAGLGIVGPANNPSLAVRVLGGFSQPVILTLIGLFVVSRILDVTGLTRWLARRIVNLSAGSERRIIVLFAISAAGLSLFMNNVAVGALLLPGAVQAAHRAGIKSSKVLIPVSFGALLGGMATYFTTANIIADSVLSTANPPQESLNILDFTPTGGLIALAGIGFIALFATRLLPNRAPLADEIMSRPTGSELEEEYQLNERLWEAQVQPGSPLTGKTLAQSDIGKQFGLSVVAIWHGRQAIFSPKPDDVIRPNDILLVVGREDRAYKLGNSGLKVGRGTTNGHVSERGVSFVEMVLAPHSVAQGKTLKQLEFRRKYGFTAVAIWRDGRSYRTDVADFTLRWGDSLLLVGARHNLKKLQSSSSFIALEPNLADKPLERRPAAIALAITAAAVGISILGFPVSLAMLGAAVLMVMLGLMTMEDAYRAVEWQVIFSVAAMFSVSVAMIESGLAKLIGDGLVALVSPLGPLGLAAGCYILSAVLTHIMGGQVTALVTAPIAISAAITLKTNPQAIAVATAIGCSSAFLTPLAHPVNLLIMGPGNYRPVDFLRLGFPMMLIGFVGVLIGMVLFWGL